MKIMKERPASGLVVLNMSCYFCVSGESDDHMWHFSREEGGSVPRSEIAPVSVCQAERRAQIFRSDLGEKFLTSIVEVVAGHWMWALVNP